MELGQLCFGNPTAGKFEIPRGVESLEETFDRLTRATNRAQNEPADSSYIYPFENKIFSVRPYYWGDCTCGFEEKNRAWEDSHQHAPDCYQTRITGLDFFENRAEIEAICKEMKLPFPEGCGVHCTCSYETEHLAWLKVNGHTDVCPTIQPNFLHKESGYAISWYKYPFRGAYGSQEKTPEEITAIFVECLASLKKK